MNTKLTLTIEQTIIEKAKKYANGKGRSLSNIVENYLKAITKEDNIESIDLTPIVKSLKGTFKAPKNIDYKKELSKRLTEKYLQQMKRVLIDTDVILDFFFDREPFSDDAAKVLSLCESRETFS